MLVQILQSVQTLSKHIKELDGKVATIQEEINHSKERNLIASTTHSPYLTPIIEQSLHKERILDEINYLDYEKSIHGNLLLKEVKAIFSTSEPIKCSEYIQVNSLLNNIFNNKRNCRAKGPPADKDNNERKLFLTYICRIVNAILPANEEAKQLNRATFINNDIINPHFHLG